MKLNLKEIRKELPIKITRGLASVRLKDFYKPFKDKKPQQVDWDVYLPSKGMNLQRPFVWTLEQKQELILSFFKGINISDMTFIMAEKSNASEKTILVVDGKQRLSTLIDFALGKFPFNWEGAAYYYKDLDENMQKELDYHYIRADVAYEYHTNPVDLISDDLKIAWFELINFTGTPQDKQHLINLKS